MNVTLPPERNWPSPPDNEARLESWGEIAGYLRRDIRTVQRWERALGLPVRRLLIGKLSSIYAYRSELDKWYAERQPVEEPADKFEGASDPVEEPSKTAIQPDAGGNTSGSWRLWRVIALTLSILIFSTAASVYFYLLITRPHEPPKAVAAAGAEKLRLFVRPFANHSGDPSQNQFISGLDDEIIAQLGRVDPAHLGVIAPTSSELLGSRSIEELGKLLHVQYVLEGSCRRNGSQVRINIELIQVSDQTHLWADSYSGDLSDIPGVQDKVAVAVATQIHVALPKTPASAPKISPAAYDEYIKGRGAWARRELRESIGAYERSLADDPSYAPAYAGLASAYLLYGSVPNDGMPPMEATPKARASAEHALKLDSSIAEAHCVLANIAMSYDWDFATAEREYQRAIDLDPNYATAHEWFAHYLIVRNRLPEAQTEMSYALNLDPFSPLLNTARAETYYYSRDYDAAIRQAQGTLDQHPNFLLARFWLASAYREKKMYPQAIVEFERIRKESQGAPAMLMSYGHALAVSGDTQGARKALTELEQLKQRHYVPALYFAAVYTGLGQKQEAITWLYKAYAEHDDRLIYNAVEPMADSLRSELRFQDLLKSMGLARKN
jgi:TolB-like protein/Flp pilus assembly protein TadD